MKKRNELPNYKKISIEIDKDKILSVLEDNKDKLINYRDNLNVKCASPFLNELYEQIPITELTEGSDYSLPLAGHRDVKYDERNYTTLVECLRGTYVEDVIKMFKSFLFFHIGLECNSFVSSLITSVAIPEIIFCSRH